MTDQELRDELVTLLLAGHETTATSVAWAIERLVRHPDKLARLVAEIDAGESDEYMQAVISETLRVRPVVPLVVRVLQEPLSVGARELPGALAWCPRSTSPTAIRASMTHLRSSVPSAFWTVRRRRSLGYPSAAASVAASALRLRLWR